MKKQTFNKFAKLLSTAVLLIAAVCLIAIITLCVNGAKPNVFVKSPSMSDDSAYIGLSRLGRTPDYGQNYIDKIVFIGDTTISPLAQIGAIDAALGDLQIWSGTDGSLPLDYSIDKAEVLHLQSNSFTAGEAAANKKPEYIVITVGIENGVAYCGEDKFKSYYSKLIEALEEASPASKIILQSVFPVSEEYEEKHPSLTNDKITRANLWIEELASEKDLKYLDTSSALKSDSGALDKAYDSGDGLHLNQSGYLSMLEYIRTHGYR